MGIAPKGRLHVEAAVPLPGEAGNKEVIYSPQRRRGAEISAEKTTNKVSERGQDWSLPVWRADSAVNG
jgi:hypothetical protein